MQPSWVTRVSKKAACTPRQFRPLVRRVDQQLDELEGKGRLAHASVVVQHDVCPFQQRRQHGTRGFTIVSRQRLAPRLAGFILVMRVFPGQAGPHIAVEPQIREWPTRIPRQIRRRFRRLGQQVFPEFGISTKNRVRVGLAQGTGIAKLRRTEVQSTELVFALFQKAQQAIAGDKGRGGGAISAQSGNSHSPPSIVLETNNGSAAIPWVDRAAYLCMHEAVDLDGATSDERAQSERR